MAYTEYQPYNMYCVRFEYVNGAETIVEEVGWTEQCPAGWYLSMPPDQYVALLTAYRDVLSVANGSGSTGGSASFTAVEIQALKYQAANPSPWNLSISDGFLVASSVLGVWAIGYCWRSIINFFSGGYSQED